MSRHANPTPDADTVPMDPDQLRRLYLEAVAEAADQRAREAAAAWVEEGPADDAEFPF
jgi:hypothetical protein